MRKLVYYVGTTLDGYIAGPNGEYDFLPIEPDVTEALLPELPETIPTLAREHMGLTDTPNRRFDTVLMGSASYQPGLDAGTTSPYDHLDQYVFSKSRTGEYPGVTMVRDDAVDFVADLKRRDGADIWLCGGGKLAASLAGLIDELIIKRYPLVIGAGIPLFDGPFRVSRWTPFQVQEFASGALVTRYRTT
ncbi:dihydrofolate reductase family protein [Stackebrandtia albiflava]|nr:dihydrofolate reductase family protein [Stackebrandtia albiflava]